MAETVEFGLKVMRWLKINDHVAKQPSSSAAQMLLIHRRCEQHHIKLAGSINIPKLDEEASKSRRISESANPMEQDTI